MLIVTDVIWVERYYLLVKMKTMRVTTDPFLVGECNGEGPRGRKLTRSPCPDVTDIQINIIQHDASSLFFLLFFSPCIWPRSKVCLLVNHDNLRILMKTVKRPLVERDSRMMRAGE